MKPGAVAQITQGVTSKQLKRVSDWQLTSKALRPLPENPPSQPLPLFDFLVRLWRYRDGMIYLSPAPLYHSAPQAAVSLTIRLGGTAIIMERFDPEDALKFIQQYKVTTAQWVPTHFVRMLKLPPDSGKTDVVPTFVTPGRAARPCRRQSSNRSPPSRRVSRYSSRN